jgi:hypothetical protein
MTARNVQGVILALAMLVDLGSPAHAISRSCTGYYRLFASHIDGTLQPSRTQELPALGVFQATRSCAIYDPNSCRRRAGVSVRACLGAHYASRDADAAPNACRVSYISGYTLTGLSNAILDRVCSAHPFAGTVTIAVHATVVGDTDCGGEDFRASESVLGNITFVCNLVAYWGLTNPSVWFWP